MRKVLGREVAENEYVAYVPGETVTFKTVSGPIDLQACYAVTAGGDGTDLACTLDLLKGRGLPGLFLPLIAKSIQKQMIAASYASRRCSSSAERQKSVSCQLRQAA